MKLTDIKEVNELHNRRLRLAEAVSRLQIIGPYNHETFFLIHSSTLNMARFHNKLLEHLDAEMAEIDAVLCKLGVEPNS